MAGVPFLNEGCHKIRLSLAVAVALVSFFDRTLCTIESWLLTTCFSK
jgi:hypothetical protein